MMSVTNPRDRMLAGSPVVAHRRDVGGVDTSVLEAGAGPPLVLLHGGVESGGIMWTPVMAQLARSHRVIAPDLPGLGESEPVDRMDLDAFTAWFERFLDAAELERPALVAHSLLGSMAARWAAGRGDRLGRLVVYAAPGVGPYRMPWKLRYVAIRFAIRPTDRNAERFDRYLLYDLDATRRLDPDWYAAFDEYNRTLAQQRRVKRTMRQLIGAQTKPIDPEELDRISVSTALLWGREDRMVPLAIGESAARRQGWPLHVVDGAAHAPHVEQPRRFVEALTQVLAPAP
jgi:2-hydroxymuconate-semialdehyde hydrolase